jgi:hypothetical protein
MLVPNSSEIWRVKRARFLKLCVQKYVFWCFFYDFTVTVYQHYQSKICDQLIETDIQ